MMEVTGLVLGGIPIAIWALEKYAEPFEAFRHYRTSIETFRTDLILQNRHLQTTLANIGLGSEPTGEELRECFERQFPSISRELLLIVRRMDEVTALLLRNLEVDTIGKPVGISDKFQWEWRRVKHSFSTKKRNKVVEDLRNWNDDLRRSLEKPEIPAEDDSIKVEYLKRRFNIQRCDSIRLCLASLHRALEYGFSCPCSPAHEAGIYLDWEAYESSESKPFKVAVSYATPLHQSCSWQKLCFTLDTPPKNNESTTTLLVPTNTSNTLTREPSSSLSMRSFVTHFKRNRSSSHILPQHAAEEKTSTLSSSCKEWNSPSSTTSVSSATSSTITSLCATLCEALDPLQLKGILEDPDEDQKRRFLLDSSYNQADISRIIEPVSLRSLFEADRALFQSRPWLLLSTKQRYGIAASVAWSVLHLSGSSWFNDHWDYRQVNIFLEKTHAGHEVLSRHPCSSYIFSPNAKITAEDFAEENLRNLIPNRTIFSLGIFLIELCINKRFAAAGGDNTVSPSLLDDYQAALGHLDEVYRLAGDPYGYAAERCVKFSFQGRDLYKQFSFSQFRQQFYDTVVAPVQATYLLFPGSRDPE
ncbi:hypothetical protein N7493_005495 [Penicillium malachiteum]|uniref:DUF7580 domain-containing protein n=1 Tax=Penicillium malachiteum TaxID=1324776 RepID=A0AAD6HMS9_9EURO|nr:hypothetical protein N7493_005495 [Penicillium malachiteum]